MKSQNILRVIFVMLFPLISTLCSAQTIAQQTLKHLKQIKAISADADEKTVEAYNKQLEEAWKFFDAKKLSVLPILRRELSLELQREQPNNMLLLDIGSYLRLQGSTADKELSKAALFKLNPAAEIVYVNQQQFFEFAYSVAADQDPRVLPFLDKAFLRQEMTAYVPQHALGLNETLVCVFLYGIHGEASEAHLRNLLKEKALTRKILEILNWIGTPDSVPDVQAAMFADRSYETFNRGTTFMMKVGGPAGRGVMLALTPKDFDTQSQDYLERIRPQIDATSYVVLRKEFSIGVDFAAPTKDEVKKGLAKMYENYGGGFIDPRAILDSHLPRSFLINKLLRIRPRLFHRLSDEGLSDVLATNSILNALYYRKQ